MKYIRLILVNIIVSLALIIILAIVAYFIGKNRIDNFFEMTGPKQAGFFQQDSLAMFIHKANITIPDYWGKPGEEVTTIRRTNNLGFRENEDTVDKMPNEYRILVTGDSHTDGVIKHNHFSFVNRWEDLLNSSDSITYYNCINGGTAYYTFRNYSGFLKKYASLKPDMFVVNVFTGNDFREAPIFEDNRTNISNVFKNIYSRSWKIFYSKEIKEVSYTQGLEQSIYFKSFANDKLKALQLAKKYMLEIKQLCAKENIKLIVTLLPSRIETNSSFKQEIQQLFDLDNDEIQTNEKLTNEFITWLNKENIKNINLKKPLENAIEKVYWDVDLHININGHRVIGDYLFENINLKEQKPQ